MDNRKRIRLAGGGVGGVGAGATANTSAVPINGIHGVSLSAGNVLGGGGGGTATMLNIGGGHSYYLTSGSETLELPANVFLTICGDDDIDDEDNSEDEFLIETTTTTTTTTTCHNEQQTTHIIKQEPTTPPTTTNVMPNVQYRLVNPRKLQKTTTAHTQPPPLVSTTAAPTTTTTTTGAAAAILPTSLQLPSGCEIYLVKEFVDNNNTTTVINSMPGQGTAIKLEPNVCLTPPRPPVTAQPQFVRGCGANVPGLVATSTKLPPEPRTPKAAQATPTTGGDEMKLSKRSYILEAYKKRDDKRRATHNEVERRRRDKINSWIFKLKEMLPSEMSAASNEAALLCPQQQQQQPRKICDSKSQILIKACEYIKAIQDELKNLRECLTANEHETQRLQNELNLYKTSQVSSSSTNNRKPSNSCSPTATMTMSSSPSPSSNGGNFMLGGHMSATTFYSLVDPSSSSSSLGGLKEGEAHHEEPADAGDTFSTNFTTKRELIITDYVD